MALLGVDMPEKPALDVSATSSTPLTGKEIMAAMDALIAEGHPLSTLTQRQVWKKLGTRGSMETVSKWFKRYVEAKATPNGSGPIQDDKPEEGGGAGEASSTGLGGTRTASGEPDISSPRTAADDTEGGSKTGGSSAEDPSASIPPVHYPSVPGAVLALLQSNFVRDLTSLKESHQRERELLHQQTEDRVARARAEVRTEVMTAMDRRRRYALVGVAGLCVLCAAIAALSGFVVGRAEGGKESLKVIGDWVEQERTRASVTAVPPSTKLPSGSESEPNAPIPPDRGTAQPQEPASSGPETPVVKPEATNPKADDGLPSDVTDPKTIPAPNTTPPSTTSP